MSQMMVRGEVRWPATFTNFHPFAAVALYLKASTPPQEAGTPVWVAAGLVETILVLNVLDAGGSVEVIDVGVAGGASGTTFASTNFWKSAFRPADKSKFQCPKLECTLNNDVFLAGSNGAFFANACAKGRVLPVPGSRET